MGQRHLHVLKQKQDITVFCVDPKSTEAHYSDWKQAPHFDFAIVATPAATHYTLCKELLKAHKNVLIEKPFCLCPQEARELQKLAHKNQVKLLVSHTEAYNPALLKLQDFLTENPQEHIKRIEICREGPTPDWARDNDVLWDLGIHDLERIAFFWPQNSNFLTNSSYSISESDSERVQLKNSLGFTIDLACNWNSPVRRRFWLLYFKEYLLEIDLVQPSFKWIKENYDFEKTTHHSSLKTNNPLQEQLWDFINLNQHQLSLKLESAIQAVSWVHLRNNSLPLHTITAT
jgi:predicted dehydrogenase